jgi:TRAP-type mannitol/chloroaromatic compound transport system permease large subunit
MSDAALGMSMLGLIVVVIMLGFPTAFTLMGLGMFFGFIAFYNPSEHWLDNKIFDLMVQRAYGAMTNETLLSIPLFVLMGYVMERGALVDKMFHSVQLAFRRVPGSLAVATLIICTFWGIASGLVGAVVVLMGVIAMRPMLNAGYDVKLASGVITAGGTLGILIPPSVMIIVYAAVAGQSVVKLYAAAMAPGFFLAFLYLVYVIAWAIVRPQDAPRLPLDQQRAPITPPVAHLAASYSKYMLPAVLAAVVVPARALRAAVPEARVGYLKLVRYLLDALVPLLLTAVTLGAIWWYVTIYSQKDASPGPAPVELSQEAGPQTSAPGDLQEPPSGGAAEPPGSGASAAAPEPASSDLATPPGAETEAAKPPEALQELGEPVAAP